MSDTVRRLSLAGREIVLVGTAHVSKESVDEVGDIIRAESPDRVCVELDQGRYNAMVEENSWERLDIRRVLKEGRGFLLLANLVLSSYQKRLGASMGVKPGDEMRKALDVAAEMGIPTALCDRDISLTLKRAWSKCGLWSKAKLMTALLSSALTTEKMDAAQIESLKNKNELDGMMGELADFLPAVKEVLIDERDRYLATKIFESEGFRLVAVIGAGHMGGVVSWLEKLAAKEAETDVSAIEVLPPPSVWGKAAGWVIPILLVALIASGFFFADADISLKMLIQWVLLNGSLAAVGCIAALGHPLSVITSFFAAPIGTINPFLAVGVFSGVAEATLRKPRVLDLEHLTDDISSVKGFYRNRITRALLVFFLSSLGGAIGNFIALPSIMKTLFDSLAL